MILWRIAADTRRYPADDLSGGVAAVSPGRWNDEKQAVLYTASTIAISVLETVAHIDDAGVPLNRYLIRIDVPNEVWKKREEVDLASLPITWAAMPAGRGSVNFGSVWIASGRSPILLVPSVIVPEERAVLVNPLHSLFRKLKASIVRPFEYNRLFRS